METIPLVLAALVLAGLFVAWRMVRVAALYDKSQEGEL